MNDPHATDGFEDLPSRYIVGIDLGTTNCAVAFVDTEQADAPIRIFPVEQWVDFGTSEKRNLLPSFHYQPLPSELTSLQGAGALASGSEAMVTVVGALARDRGLQLPGRQISSAKSWLSHSSVDRQSPILPWQCDEGVEKLSPVEASARYLAQIKRAWNRTFKSHPLDEQEVMLTLPASFDQVARQLTIEAAKQAGLARILPIEEPQAAFYAWLSRNSEKWESLVQVGQTILVCDIGGGTTDFTLIRVRESASSELPQINELHQQRFSLHRVAVGQHLILGGDNIDLALAKFAERKLTGGKSLPPRSWDALRQACRVAKETLLATKHDNKTPINDSFTIHLPGTGSKLIGGGNQVEITASEIAATVLEGFFPYCDVQASPMGEQTGFQEFGLPFAADPRVTSHLASFLWNHRRDGRTDEALQSMDDLQLARPDWILFNGGVMTSELLSQRLLDVIASWFAGSSGIAADWRAGVLDGESLDLAVAIGAAYFGKVRRGEGVQIEAKLACSYYLQTSSNPPQAICIVPGSASLGDNFELDQQPLELAIGEPVQFPLLYSTTRLADRVSESVPIDDEHLVRLPPIRTVLDLAGRKRRDRLPVIIATELTQIGTLQMWCRDTTGKHRWKLEFDVRGSTQTDFEANELSANNLGILDEQVEATARNVLQRTFGETGGEVPPAKLMSTLTEELHLSRSNWTPSLLRAMWQALMEMNAGRRKSAAHEARWLNLLGYSLRPGYGLAADDWRVAETWRAVHGKLAFAAPSSRNESLILWRRIAGGFTAGQQLTVYQQIAGPLRAVLDPTKRSKGSGTSPHELIELLRLVGSLELLPKSEKHALGDWLLDLIDVKKWTPCQPAILWTLGRIGTRFPAYGPLNVVVDVHVATAWIEQLLGKKVDIENMTLALMLCARRVHDRYRDIADDLRDQVTCRLEERNAPEHVIELVRNGGRLKSEEATQMLGESLPLGLQFQRQTQLVD